MLSSIWSFNFIRSVLVLHHSLDYTRTWHLEKLCVLIVVDFDPWHSKYMYSYLKQWYNPKPLWIRLIPSYFIWDSAYLVWAWLHLQYFCNVCILGHYMSILLFPAPPNHQYGKCSKYWWCILTICIYGRYLGVETVVQFFFVAVVAAYFWMALLGMEIWHVGQNAMFVFWWIVFTLRLLQDFMLDCV